MFQRSLFRTLFSIAILLGGSIGAFAQTSPVSGTVELQKTDGTRVPVAGAVIDVYRTDIKSGFPSAKTGKKGDFAFAGLQLGAVFMFSVSAPGCSPTVYPDVKAGQDKLLITLSPGDGSKLTEADARRLGASKPASTDGSGKTETAEMTADQKKQMADHEAEVKRVTERNDKAKKTNEIVLAVLKEGNDAFAAKNYNLAITKYEEGIAADPDFVGSAPIFYNNRGAALQARAIETYNKSVKEPDATAKVAGIVSAKKDLTDGAQGYLNSWNVMKNAPAADIQDKANFDSSKLNTLRGAKDIFRMAIRTEQVDLSAIEAAKILIPEYVAIETDAAKKAEANLAFADLYRVAGDSPNAIAAYKKILETSPDDLEALVGVGLSLVNLGYINTDKAMLQEGANFLQKFAGMAPDTNKYKADAVALIEVLKKEQNVTPQKVTTTTRKKN